MVCAQDIPPVSYTEGHTTHHPSETVPPYCHTGHCCIVMIRAEELTRDLRGSIIPLEEYDVEYRQNLTMYNGTLRILVGTAPLVICRARHSLRETLCTVNCNQIESFNGNMLRMREIIRGLKKEDPAILAGL